MYSKAEAENTSAAPSVISSEEVQAENEEPKTAVPPNQYAADTHSAPSTIPSEEAQAGNEESNSDTSPDQLAGDTLPVPPVIPFGEELVEEEKTAVSANRLVCWEDTLVIEVPGSFLTSTDAAVIGPNRVLVAVDNNETEKLDCPYRANQSMTILFGPDISDIAEADTISDRLGLVNPKICIDTPELNVRYAFRERVESLSIFAGLISTVCKTYPFQFFLREQSEDENTSLIERILKSISISGKPSSTPKKISATQTIPKEKYTQVWKAETDVIKESNIPCPPGQEPAQLKEKVERFLAKLEVAYPDKTVVYLHRDHKKLGERLTYLYRELGYPDGSSMLRAYGYTPKNPSGRPSKDHVYVIDELKRRYSNGPKCVTITQLKRDNPDLAPRIHTLHNQTWKLFGKDFAEYLREQNILI